MQDSWRHFFARYVPVVLQEGCRPEALASAEQELGAGLPPKLRELLLETDGVRDAYGYQMGWSLARIVEENTSYGKNGRLALGPGLLAFGDDGTGNPFCLELPTEGTPADTGVYWWGWIGGERVAKAGSLREFWHGWLTGEIST